MGYGLWDGEVGEQRVTLLKQLWDESWPTNFIAERIGTTRNSVIGKAHRLGLPKHQNGRLRDQKAAPRYDAAAAKMKRAQLRIVTRRKLQQINQGRFVMVDEASVVMPKDDPTPAPPTADVPMSQRPKRVTLWRLGKLACHWPEGNGHGEGFWFECCEPRMGGSFYCALHARMAYRPARRAS